MTARDIWLNLVVACAASFAAIGLGVALGWSDGALGVAIIVAGLLAMFGYDIWLERTGRKPAPPKRKSS
jgi:hypothetical protein